THKHKSMTPGFCSVLTSVPRINRGELDPRHGRTLSLRTEEKGMDVNTDFMHR
ncbi:hypothetical protein XENOCAPTIV_004329, partial [Xenoophorus captivus]